MAKPWPVITLEELAKHKTKQDAWMSLKGKVYDITFYMNKHPGGIEPLMGYLGRDGTKAFNSVHPYVNFERILKGREKGILEGTPQPPKPRPVDNRKSGKIAPDDFADDKEHEVVHYCCGCCTTKDPRFPKTSFYNSPIAVIYEIKFDEKALEMPSSEDDWSMGLEQDGKLFTVKKFVDVVNVWIASYRIINPVSYEYLECSFSDNFNTCKIILQKDQLGSEVKWKKLGVPLPISHSIEVNTEPTDLYTAKIVHKKKLTSNTNLYGIQVRPCVKFGLLIGHHINIHLRDLIRPYTPVCFSILDKPPPTSVPKTGQIFWFIIKTYTTWGLTEKLEEVPLSSASPIIKLSSPQGNFDSRWLSQNPITTDTPFSVVVMFAAGTGITPMVRILQNIRKRLQAGEPSTHSHAILMFWNKSEEDIIWKEEFLELSNTTSRSIVLGGGSKGGGKKWFSFLPVLTHPTKAWEGLMGRPCQEHIAIMETLIPGKEMEHCERQALICGPTGFCKTVQSIIGANFTEDKVYVFQG